MIIAQIRLLPTAIYLVDPEWNVFKLRGDLRLAADVVIRAMNVEPYIYAQPSMVIWADKIVPALLPLIESAPRWLVHRCRIGLLHPINRSDHFFTCFAPRFTNDPKADLAYRVIVNRRKRCC